MHLANLLAHWHTTKSSESAPKFIQSISEQPENGQNVMSDEVRCEVTCLNITYMYEKMPEYEYDCTYIYKCIYICISIYIYIVYLYVYLHLARTVNFSPYLKNKP